MNIQLKRLHIAFCMGYLPGLNTGEVLKSLNLLLQLNTVLGNYDMEDEAAGNEVVTVSIKGQTLADAWHVMSQEKEGMTAVIAREMVTGGEGFTGLETQIGALAQQGDPDALIVYEKMQFLTANYAQQRKDQIKANLNRLKEWFAE